MLYLPNAYVAKQFRCQFLLKGVAIGPRFDGKLSQVPAMTCGDLDNCHLVLVHPRLTSTISFILAGDISERAFNELLRSGFVIQANTRQPSSHVIVSCISVGVLRTDKFFSPPPPARYLRKQHGRRCRYGRSPDIYSA